MIPVIQNSFVSGELSPSFLGRTDKPQYRNGASTMRNAFVRYQGGAYSRAGLQYCGMCKQAAPNKGGTTASQPSSGPPRLFNFQYSINQGFALEFGDYYMRILSQGAYVTETAQAVTAITNANPGVITITNHGYSNGDWVFGSNIGGMTGLNGLTWIVQNVTTNTFTLTDLFGNTVNTINYPSFTAGGTFARIYTVVSPYAAVDLPYLKIVQNANLMNLDCWNQLTGTQYPPYSLTRTTNTNWAFTQVSFTSPITAPSGVTTAVTSSTTPITWYSYEVTAVDLLGNESVASAPAYAYNNDISINAGSNTITWTSSGITNVSQYNIYAATPVYTGASVSNPGFNGVPYGLIGSSAYTVGTEFIDTNIIPDFTTSPPLNINPFGSTGNYPGTVQYFQQRLVHANTVNAPNTYNMSQPGLNNNFDYSIPSVDSDAITGTPWGIQVNGIQWMVPTITGLLMFMGNGVWLVSGGNTIAITPADQNAQLQSQIGCSATVFPLLIGIHVIYVQAKNSIVRDINYNFLYNVFTGTDITVFSNHLFLGYTLTQWCYAEEPYKIVWVIRNDGNLLSLTYIKEQEIEGWARHDTNGLFISVCSVIEPSITNQNVSYSVEPPIDAVYTIVQRYIPGTAVAPAGKWVYYAERFNNRIWQNIEDCVCVDASLFYPLTFPPATLTPSAAEGTANITSTNLINGGKGYTNPKAVAVDSSGAGGGATFTATQVGGIITAITPVSTGQYYTLGLTSIIVTDPTGIGAVVQPIITNDVTFTSSASAFYPSLVGSVIRTNGGKATITSYNSSTSVVANITSPLTQTIPNDPNVTCIPAISNTWSISTPITAITGLNHLEGMQVTGLADGGVINPIVVQSGGITLQNSASAIVIGLPYTVQAQTMPLEMQSQATVQGRRKDVQAVTVRLEASRGIQAGTNQPDASAQPNQATIAWTNMKEIKERNNLINAGTAIPLLTGDVRILVPGDWATNGQVAVQQVYPLPMNLLAVIPEVSLGDNPS